MPLFQAQQPPRALTAPQPQMLGYQHYALGGISARPATLALEDGSAGTEAPAMPPSQQHQQMDPSSQPTPLPTAKQAEAVQGAATPSIDPKSVDDIFADIIKPANDKGPIYAYFDQFGRQSFKFYICLCPGDGSF